MRSSSSIDLTQGPVAAKLLRFTIPIFISTLIQQLYGVVDRAVVGQFAENGTQALAAVGSTAPATELLLGVFSGMALGANITCANMRGARDEQGIRDCMHTAMLLAVLSGMLLFAVGGLFARPILEAFDTPEVCMEQAVLYVRIYFIGTPGSLIYNFGGNLLRANGDTKRPMYILMITGLVNVGLNLLFVIVFKMSVAGVAFATIISQYLSAAAVVYILFSPKGEYKMQLRKLRIHKAHLLTILRTGIPGGLNGMVFSLSNSVVLSAINSFNSAVVSAAKTAARDLSSIVNVVIASFYTGCVSFAGQCFGAKKYRRIDRLAASALGMGSIAVLAVAGLCTVFRYPLIGMFNSDPDVIQTAIPLLMIQAWFYIIYLFSQIALGCLRGMKWSVLPTTVNLVSICVPRIIWCMWIFPLHRTLTFLYICYPISWVISASLQWGGYFYARKKLSNQIQSETLQ